MKRSILIIALFVLTLFSCDYDYVPYFEAPKPQIELQDLPAYAHFKMGTYWIYKDSASGVEDSVYVFYDTVYSYYTSGNTFVSPGYYDYFECHAHSYTDNYNYYYKIDMGYYGLNGLLGVYRVKTKPGDYVGQSVLMSNRFDPSVPFYAYGSPGVIFFKHYYDTINLGNDFFKVVHFNDSENASENISTPFGSINPATDFYISKNIGTVKRRIYDTVFNTINKTDNLIRYHIVQ